jgi:multidrug efflux pump subunit AcrA (membrane-fusion protein)
VPALQVGDMVPAGMAVAQIPDLKNWEVSARIGELDRGHLAAGQPAEVQVAALPGRKFRGRIKTIGGTTGPPWDRAFETRIALEDPIPELRPGMSARLRITTEVMKDVLWLPSQALFEADGRKFVYARTGASFSPKNVELKRRSETQVIIAGLREGEVVSLANPDQMKKPEQGKSGAMQAIPK